MYSPLALARAVLSLSAVLTLSTSAYSQCFNCPPGTVVDANYNPSPTGAYVYYPNEPYTGTGGAGYYNFSIEVNGQLRPIPMADPTILKVGDYYYVTGTSDAATDASGSNGPTNFAIYKSLDLVNWKPHMLAFGEQYFSSPPQTSVYDSILSGPWNIPNPVRPPTNSNFIGGKRYRNLAAPQLFMDPNDACTVYIAFNAIPGEDVSGNVPPPTILSSRITLKAFIEGGKTNTFDAPQHYGYRLSNTLKYDGGKSLSKFLPTSSGTTATPATSWVPSTPASGGTPFGSSPNQQFFQQSMTGNGWSAFTNPRAAWLSIDPFVYFDAGDQTNGRPRPWLCYTWFGGQDSNWGGNNSAAVELTSATELSASAMWRPLAYRFHLWYIPRWNNESCSNCVGAFADTFDPTKLNAPFIQLANGSALNGTLGRNGQRIILNQPSITCASVDACGLNGVAEAPAAFRRTNDSNTPLTYVLYSRNDWDSAAYGIFYRLSSGALKDTGLPTPWSHGSALAGGGYDGPEYQLLMNHTDARSIPGGPSYGHGEVFVGPSVTGQTTNFLIFHGKQQATGNSYPNGYSGRTVYFKELRFDSAGYIQPIWDAAAPGQTSVNTVRGFIVPRQ